MSNMKFYSCANISSNVCQDNWTTWDGWGAKAPVEKKKKQAKPTIVLPKIEDEACSSAQPVQTKIQDADEAKQKKTVKITEAIIAQETKTPVVKKTDKADKKEDKPVEKRAYVKKQDKAAAETTDAKKQTSK